MPMNMMQVPRRISLAQAKRGMGGANKGARVPSPGAARRLALSKTRIKKY